jgi:large subunit ribosomal protein L6
MSRIGKHAIAIPQGVEIKLDGQVVSAKGKLGQGQLTISDDLSVTHADGKITIALRRDDRKARSMWGTSRTNINNLVNGVATGFSETLEINGVGYRAAVQGKELVMQLGYTHDVKYAIPAGVTIRCDKPTSIFISGPSKQQVGQIAAELRSWRPPEPYKGKGVKYESETIRRKEGKKK